MDVESLQHGIHYTTQHSHLVMFGSLLKSKSRPVFAVNNIFFRLVFFSGEKSAIGFGQNRSAYWIAVFSWKRTLPRYVRCCVNEFGDEPVLNSIPARYFYQPLCVSVCLYVWTITFKQDFL